MYHQGLSCFYTSPLACDSRSDTSTESDQHDPHTDQPSCLIPGELTKYSSLKAKSSLCRNFTEKGYCPYGKKCQFAHGPQQLRINMETNRSYKTKGCHAFAKKGYCCYGQRCNFIHQRQPSVNTLEKWSIIYQNHRETLRLVQNKRKSRLLQLLDQWLSL